MGSSASGALGSAPGRSRTRGPRGGKRGSSVVEFPGRRKGDSTPAPALPADPLRPTVFHEEWWLRAVTGGDWEEATVSRDGTVIGRSPHVIRKTHGGARLCTMPELTHFLGPAVDPGPGSASTEQARVARIVGELVRRLPRTPASYHKVHAGMADMVPFQEEGYDVGVQFTYEISPAPEADTWKGMRDKTRNAIRGSKARVMLDRAVEPGEFVRFMARNLEERGLEDANGIGRVMAACEESLSRGRGVISATRAASGKLTAAIFCPSDATRSHYLLSTRSATASSGDVSLLVWDAIRRASAAGLAFDFDGIGSAGSVGFFEGFGGIVRPRFIATRYSRFQKALMLVRPGAVPAGPRFY